MSDDQPKLLRVSAIRNLALRRAAIVVTLPLLAVGNVIFGVLAVPVVLWRVACKTWSNQIGMVKSAARQWRAGDGGSAP